MLFYLPNYASVVVDTPELMLPQVGHTIGVLGLLLVLQDVFTIVENFALNQDSDDSSNPDCILRNMDYFPIVC